MKDICVEMKITFRILSNLDWLNEHGHPGMPRPVCERDHLEYAHIIINQVPIIQTLDEMAPGLVRVSKTEVLNTLVEDYGLTYDEWWAEQNREEKE